MFSICTKDVEEYPSDHKTPIQSKAKNIESAAQDKLSFVPYGFVGYKWSITQAKTIGNVFRDIFSLFCIGK